MRIKAPRFSEPAMVMVLVCLVLCALELAAVLYVTAGHVLYSQDDPYIHLALARHLADSFHYGLNEGEASSPASSILYPFLLAIGIKLGLGAVSALVLCVVATFAAGVLINDILLDVGYRLELLSPWAWAAICAVLLLGGNLIGAAFTGMEHSLHIALTLGALRGVQRFRPRDRLAWGWVVCAGLCPLVRYEGVSLWISTIGLLVWHRRWGAAAGLFAGTAACLAGFSAWLVAHRLPPLPSSVLSKGQVGGVGGEALADRVIALLHAHFGGQVMAPGFQLLLVTTLLCAGATLMAWRDGRRNAARIGVFGTIIGGCHLAIGTYGNIGRYEAYAVTASLICCMAASAGRAAPFVARLAPARLAIGLALAFLLLNVNVGMAVNTPLAARNVYDQPYQLHRFVRDFWRGPVGVNDIGEVSYGNPYYVLDLAGLASEEARMARAHEGGRAWMDVLVRRHGVGLVMIFRDWFGAVPANWVVVGTLHLLGPNTVLGGSTVTFFATTPAAAARLRGLLPAFAAGLPGDDRFVEY